MNLNTLVPALTAGVLALSMQAADPKMSPADVEQGRQYLQQTRNYVIGATKGLSAAQWKFKPSPDRWSIAEILEHIVVTQEFGLGPIKAQLANAPSASNPNAKTIDAVVMQQFPDRTKKFTAPEMLQPTGRWTPGEMLERLNKNHALLIAQLESTPDLREHSIPAPPLKALSKGAYENMDGYQWILASAGHTERHTKQILEVKADPNFPAQ